MHLFHEVRLMADGRRQFYRDVDALAARALARLRLLGVAWAARRQRARQVRELASFTDRELWDVGLSRADVHGLENGQLTRSN